MVCQSGLPSTVRSGALSGGLGSTSSPHEPEGEQPDQQGEEADCRACVQAGRCVLPAHDVPA